VRSIRKRHPRIKGRRSCFLNLYAVTTACAASGDQHPRASGCGNLASPASAGCDVASRPSACDRTVARPAARGKSAWDRHKRGCGRSAVERRCESGRIYAGHSTDAERRIGPCRIASVHSTEPCRISAVPRTSRGSSGAVRSTGPGNSGEAPSTRYDSNGDGARNSERDSTAAASSTMTGNSTGRYSSWSRRTARPRRRPAAATSVRGNIYAEPNTAPYKSGVRPNRLRGRIAVVLSRQGDRTLCHHTTGETLLL